MVNLTLRQFLPFAKVLTDVRLLVEKRLPVAYRGRPHWRMAATVLLEAAAGGDVEEMAVVLALVCAVEGLPRRPKTGRASVPIGLPMSWALDCGIRRRTLADGDGKTPQFVELSWQTSADGGRRG